MTTHHQPEEAVPEKRKINWQFIHYSALHKLDIFIEVLDKMTVSVKYKSVY